MEKFIFVIQKEVLRTETIYGGDNPNNLNKIGSTKIWCGTGEDKGFTTNYDLAEKRCNELNKNNKNKHARYVMQIVESMNNA